MRITKTFTIGALILTGLTGCSATGSTGSSMRVALTEMGATSDSEYGVYGLRMVRSVNITGLGAEEVVGSLTVDPDKWSIREQSDRLSPTRTDLPSTMAPRLVSGPSMVVERRFDSTASTVELVQLRDQLQTYQAKIAEATLLQVKKAVLDAALNAKTVKTDGNAETVAPETTAALASLYPDESLRTADEIRKASNATSTLLASVDLAAQLKAIQAILQKPGIIITNWQRESDMSASATSTVADGSMGRKKTVGGLLILGSPRIVTLYFGDDLIDRVADTASAAKQSDSLFPQDRNYITHYQLRAKQVLFAESQQSAYRANLEAHLDEVAKLIPQLGGIDSATLIKTLKADVAAQYSAVTATSESGVLEAVASSTQKRSFSLKRNEIRSFLEAEMASADGTIPVINMRVALDDFLGARMKR